MVCCVGGVIGGFSREDQTWEGCAWVGVGGWC